jgi:hypothetical protein
MSQASEQIAQTYAEMRNNNTDKVSFDYCQHFLQSFSVQ